MSSNFGFLNSYWPDLAKLGYVAELQLYADANASIIKVGLLAEAISREICRFENIYLPEQATQVDRLRSIKQAGLLPERIDAMFHAIRRGRNRAVHEGLSDRKVAEALLEQGFRLSAWLMEVYGDWSFTAPAYCQPEDTTQQADYEALLQAQEDQLKALLEEEKEARTAASGTSHAERVTQAERAAEKLPAVEDAALVAQPPLRIDINAMPVMNYALQQNGVPMIHSITIENTTDTDLEEVELTLSASPAFALPFTQTIQRIPAGKKVVLSRPKMLLDGTYLVGLTERLTGLLTLQVKQGEQVLVCDHAEVAVLAFDEWHGGIRPELLCSFVTPNHPEVVRIVARATEILHEWIGCSTMDGYCLGDPDRVVKQAAAIYAAIKEQNLAYVYTAASFETTGQRVRMCDTILQQKIGNCLDLSLLYASCLEAAGLHPLLVLMEHHIFTGVWLEDKMFPDAVQYDDSQLTKRLAGGVNEVMVMESTLMVNGNDASFDDARHSAEKQLMEKKFHYFIDVHRARKGQVYPLPMRVRGEAGWEVQHDTSFREQKAAAPAQLGETIHVEANLKEEVLPKMAQWERKLLDLDGRNNLLNLRLTKSQVTLLTSSLDALEDALADGSDFTILPKPSDWHMEQFSFEELHQNREITILQTEFENKRLRSVLTEGELTKSIKTLYRNARLALEENGANTLYLAIGLLRWYDVKQKSKARYAPIILVPIEMVRKSAAAGYVIRLRDDEPQMNITLLEKLKQDFGITIHGVDPLPMDDHGIDIRRVLTIVRQAVMEQAHWDVLEVANVGIFSFQQFVMWNDMRHRSEDLLRNKIVRSLIDGKLAWEAKPMEMGDRVNEDQVLLPMPADASQLYAIQAACQGESFVLHGPPGTGKSQTITTLIANALAQGKSVLFVAEKMAALEVVQKRLEKIGIGPFCLELHSNKSKKRDVLEQLRQASEVTKTQTAEAYAAKAKQLATMRAGLDAYNQQLHRLLPCGADLYTLINEYETYRDAPEIAPFDRLFIRALNPQALEEQRLSLEQLVAAGREVEHPHNHPLSRVGCTQFTQSLRTEAVQAAQAYLQQIQQLAGWVATLSAALGEAEPNSGDRLQCLADVAEYLTHWYGVPLAWAKAPEQRGFYDSLTRFCQHAQKAGELKAALCRQFRPEVLERNGQYLCSLYEQAMASWFLPRILGINKLVKSLRIYAIQPVDKTTVRNHVFALKEYQQELEAAKALEATCIPALGNLYQGENTDWAAVMSLVKSAATAAQGLYDLYGTYQKIHALGGDPALEEVVRGLAQGMPAFATAKTALDTLLSLQQSKAENWLEDQQNLCRSIIDNADELREWIAYVAAREETWRLGLSNVVESYAAGADHEDVYASYKRALLEGLIGDAIDDSDSLNQFSGAVFNKKIEQYREADREWTRLSQAEVYCRLASKVPNFTAEAAKSSELGILQRNIKNGGRGTSLRKLFEQIPNLLPRLCPCMLMSPISAAQYLDPNREPFDIVVFDEASQLPTCKAVGALARGKDAVVVGDPKQMPPTSFFASNTVDEDNLDVEDMESILDDCLALNMPQSHLLWHYRSRHESLIAFSNSQFYENRLFTFPSVNDRESKVRLVQVEGVFDRGKTRTNREEAEAVVAEILRRFRDPALAGQSLGVVTFNIAQQHLIDDLINAACLQDPQFEQWVYQAAEPLFVKNLENVQGDERDVILFSVGYGPDKEGVFHMNFGPLNKDGGWRRLNVAVSRARYEMVVFSSLRGDQLDLSRTGAEGVAALRSFLQYAEGRAIESESAATPQEMTDGVADTICAVLEEQGYETDLSVGRSEYRIDIGVVDPEQPDRYLLGIMLDGASYAAAKTTRDRELAQADVLSGLGWNILRVWCVDWWNNKDKEISRILTKLQDIRKGIAAPPPKAPEPVAPAAPLVPAAPIAIVDAPAPKAAPTYVAAALKPIQLTSDTIIKPEYGDEISRRLMVVLEAEAPITQSLLIRRVVQSCGIPRAGSRVQRRLGTLIRKLKPRTEVQDAEVVYWPRGQKPDTYTGFRVNGTGENHRDVLEIPVQEVANALMVVLHQQFSMEQEALFREVASKLGYTRVGSNVQTALERGLQYAKTLGGVTTGAGGAWMLTDVGTARAQASLR